MHLSADDRVGRITEWRFDALLRGIFDALHLIKAAAADDADCGKVLIHVAQAGSFRHLNFIRGPRRDYFLSHLALRPRRFATANSRFSDDVCARFSQPSHL